MKVCRVLPVVSLVLLSSGAAFAQDPVKVAPARYKVVFENPDVRVLRVNYPAGATSTMHQHPESVAVFLANSKVRFTMPDGKSEEMDAVSETASYMAAHTHNPANIGKTPVDVIVVEFKSKAPGTATLPSTRDNLAMKVLAEGPRAIVYRTTADPAFHEPAGSKHEFDQVVIALGAAGMSLMIDGKPTKTKWARGDAQFIGRGAAHESKNTGGKPADFIIVAIK